MSYRIVPSESELEIARLKEALRRKNYKPDYDDPEFNPDKTELYDDIGFDPDEEEDVWPR